MTFNTWTSFENISVSTILHEFLNESKIQYFLTWKEICPSWAENSGINSIYSIARHKSFAATEGGQGFNTYSTPFKSDHNLTLTRTNHPLPSWAACVQWIWFVWYLNLNKKDNFSVWVPVGFMKTMWPRNLKHQANPQKHHNVQLSPFWTDVLC